jgi:hypothetical protein
MYGLNLPMLSQLLNGPQLGSNAGARTYAWPVLCCMSPSKDVIEEQREFMHSEAGCGGTGKVLSLCCSRRVLLVAMVSQIMAYDVATMTVTYSAITQPAPVLRPGGQPEVGAVPLALGPRWLAHASNQVPNPPKAREMRAIVAG